MEVSTDQQFDFLRDWQRKVYEAGYFGMSWPTEYGGYGMHPEYQRIATRIMKSHDAPIMLNAIANGWTGPLLLDIGREEDKRRFIKPMLSAEEIWCQGCSEPEHGSDLGSAQTKAVRDGDEYVINGQKIWTSRAEYSDLMMLLARTTPREQVASKTEGLSIFLVDMRKVVGNGMTIKPIRTMMNHSTTEVFFDDMRIPASALVGEEGKGFRYILSGMNAERILIAAECIGDAKWFIKKASDYASARNVFGRAIGQNQGVQFPIARCYAQMCAAELMVHHSAQVFDEGGNPGAEANMAKLLASEASWAAADMCVQTHGGFGFAEEYDVERKFREARLYTVAPISTNLILSYLAEHVLGLPRSY
jgi:alkylation response protein AidB-like acyl-CoA dehydrogenase